MAEDPPASEVIYLRKYFHIFLYFISKYTRFIDLLSTRIDFVNKGVGSMAWHEKVPHVATQIFMFEPFSHLLPTSFSLPLSCFFVCICFILILVQTLFLVHTPCPLIATPLSSRTSLPLIANPLPHLKSETGEGGSLPRLKSEMERGLLLLPHPPFPHPETGGPSLSPPPLPCLKSKMERGFLLWSPPLTPRVRWRAMRPAIMRQGQW